MGAQTGVDDLLVSRSGGIAVSGSLALARCPAASVLRGLRLLAHQPELLPDSRRHAARDSCGKLCLVPLGYRSAARRTMELQPLDSIRPGIFAGVLGAHRIRLRSFLHPAQTCSKHPHRISGTADNFPGDAIAGVPPNKVERAWDRDSRLASESSPRQLSLSIKISFVIPSKRRTTVRHRMERKNQRFYRSSFANSTTSRSAQRPS